MATSAFKEIAICTTTLSSVKMRMANSTFAGIGLGTTTFAIDKTDMGCQLHLQRNRKWAPPHELNHTIYWHVYLCDGEIGLGITTLAIY